MEVSKHLEVLRMLTLKSSSNGGTSELKLDANIAVWGAVT